MIPPRAESSPSPIDFTYRFDPVAPKEFFIPRDADEAIAEMQHGNEKVARFFEDCHHYRKADGPRAQIINLSALEANGEPKGEDGLPIQLPFALVVGCSDARVPSEILFGQQFNDIFNIRVAGNVLAPECIGSLLYALKTFVPDGPGRNLRGLKVVVALGHRGCGAVKATIAAFQGDPTGSTLPADPVGSILRRIFTPAVTVGAMAFDEVFGPGASLRPELTAEVVEMAVYLNAAWAGHDLRNWVALHGGEAEEKVRVVYGVSDPADRRVHALPPGSADPLADAFFAPPPADLKELHRLGLDIAHRLHRDGVPLRAAGNA